MRKSWLGALSGVLVLVPLLWFAFFLVTYRCDLQRYSRLWRAGDTPEWLTGWELCVTLACALIALIVLPKVVRFWRARVPLTRGEWLSLAVIAVFLGFAVFAAPTAMRDPRTQIAQFLGQPSECMH